MPSIKPSGTLRYRLTADDVAAYEKLPGELGGWTKAFLVVSLAAAAGLYGFVEDEVPLIRFGVPAAAVVIWLGLVIAVRKLGITLRSRQMADREGEMTVEDRGDLLVVVSATGRREVADEMIGKVLATETHVFVLYDGGPLIVPQRAFGSADAMKAFAQRLEARSIAAAD